MTTTHAMGLASATSYTCQVSPRQASPRSITIFEGGAQATFNYGYGRGYSVLDAIKALSELTGRDLPFVFSPRRSGDPSRLIADTSALHSKLDWTPKHDTLILSTAMAWQLGLEDHDLETSSS